MHIASRFFFTVNFWLLSTFIAISNIHADESANHALPIKVTVTPNLTRGYVSLSITNQSNISLKVARELTIYDESTYQYHQVMEQNEAKLPGGKKEPPDDNEVRAAIIFDHMIIGPMDGSGVRLRPMQLAPGETKAIDLYVGIYRMKQNPSRATLLLRLNNKDFGKTVMVKMDDVWKETN